MNFEIEEIKELSGDAASIYSVTMEGEEETLLEQFFGENAGYETELDEIAKRINKAIVDKDIEIKEGKLNIKFWDYED